MSRLDAPTPHGLADLLAGENLPARVWSDADRASVFRHQWRAPLRLELAGLDRSRAAAIEQTIEADPALLGSLGSLLERREAPAEVLAVVKDFAKAMSAHPDAALPPDVARAIYALTVLAARRDGRRLSRLDDARLRALARWAAELAWLDEAAKRVVADAERALQEPA